MAINKTLAWILAGGAAVAIGGVAVWLLRRHFKNRPQPDGEPQSADPPEAEAAAEDEESAAESRRVQPPMRKPDPDLQAAVSKAAASIQRTVDIETPVATEVATEAEDSPAPQPEPEPEPAQAEGIAILARGSLPDQVVRRVDGQLHAMWPQRPQDPTFEVEAGDSVAVVVCTNPDDVENFSAETLLAQVVDVEGDELDVEIEGCLDADGPTWPRVEHGLRVGTLLTLERGQVFSVIKPPQAPVVVPKSRRKRYRVGTGQIVELRPAKRELPPGSTWSPSRADVDLRVVEQRGNKTLVTLEGAAGEVNVALLAANDKGERRPVCSWKLELVEEVA